MLSRSRTDRVARISTGRVSSRSSKLATPIAVTSSELLRLRVVNVSLAIVHSLLAFFTLFFSKKWDLAALVFSISVSFNYTSPDPMTNIEALKADIASGNIETFDDAFSATLVPFETGLPITWLTFGFFAITAFFHAGASLIWHKYYYSLLENKSNWLRWAEYSITASLMWLVLAQSFAFVEYVQLVLSTTMIAITMASGITVEYVARPSATTDAWTTALPIRLAFLLPGILLYGVAAVTLVVCLATTLDAALPVFVIPTALVTLGLFESFSIVLIWQQFAPPSRWIIGEYWYLALSLISKAFLGISLLANVLIYEDIDCLFTESC